MKVGVVVPVYCSNDEWSLWDLKERFIPHLEHIKSYNNYEFLININGNTENLIYDEIYNNLCAAIRKHNPNWQLKLVITGMYRPASMTRIRNDCMMLDPDCDLYLFVDDDTVFHNGCADNYEYIIKQFEEDNKLGVVMSAGFLGGYNYKGVLKYDYVKHWLTNRGLFLRNLHKEQSPVYSNEALEYMKAGYEDMVAAMEEIAAGYKSATMFNNPTYSKPTKMEVGKESKKKDRYSDIPEDHKIHNVLISLDSTSDYLNHRFKDIPFLSNFKLTDLPDFKIALKYIVGGTERL